MRYFQAWWFSLGKTAQQALTLALVVILGAAVAAPLLAPRPAVSVWVTPFSTHIEVNRRPVEQRDTDLDLVASNHTKSDLAIGGDVEHLAQTFKKLKQLKASIREPARSNRLLHVAIVDAHASGANAPHVGVDLKNAGDAAVVLVTQDPVIWRVDNAAPDQRAKIAVEGPSAFDVENALPGLLADFRSGAFGAADAAGSSDYINRNDAFARGRLCRALIEWARLYGVQLPMMGIWTFKNPGLIKVRESGLSTTDWVEARAVDAQSLCYPSNPFYSPPPRNANGSYLTGKSWR
jgi:hypothetical protein